MNLEYILQKQVAGYLSVKYPKVLFLSDTIASCKLTIPQALRNKAIQKQGFKTPDLIILEPISTYHGLFIELKTETPYKKDGTIKINEHLKGQLKTINDLHSKGYYACFAWSFEMAKTIIDDYLNFKG